MKKTLLLMFFATLSWQQALAQNFTDGGLKYYVTSPTTCSVGNQYQAATGVVAIPAQVTNNSTVYSVTNIANNAFKDCSGLTSVTIPNSVTSIGNSAFNYCYSLTLVTIPNSVTSIGDYAFQNCFGLTSLTIPNSVTNIGVGAFYGCSLTSVTIPNLVTTIGDYAFYHCSSLTSVTIPISVTSIGYGAFTGCSSLTSLTIPNSVTSIGNSVFNGCSGLTSVTIPNSVTSIASNTFSFCSGLTSVTIPNSVTSIGVGAFYGCSGLTSITIPNSVTSIGGSVFQDCFSLTSVTIPNSVTSIGDYVFCNCVDLTSVTIPNSVVSIGDNAFAFCSGLTSLTIPNSVTSIGAEAFRYCSGLSSVTIPNSVTSIGTYAFSFCSGLTSLTIGNSVTSIGDNAFDGCSGLTSVICNIAVPLSINATVFGNVNQATCSLKVPVASVAFYQGAAVWQNFMVSGLSNIPTTKVKANLCGATLSSINSNINADYVAGYQAYRFEVTNGATVNTVEVNKYNFSLTQTPGITYNTTYGVRVAIKMGGNWGAYGASCNVTTPTLVANVIPTTTIMPSFCGTTLAALDTKISATPVSAASGYRFEVTSDSGTDNELTMIYNSPTYNFKLSQSGTIVAYGKTYIIRVAALVDGVYGNYGAYCNVSTPVLAVNTVPTTTIQPSFCGTTLAALDTKIGAVIVAGATKGRFEVTIAGGSPVVYEVAAYNFKLSQTGVAVLYSTSYSIRVAAFVGGVWGNYGSACTVTTPAAPGARLKAKSFEVSAYPNPFETAFNLNIETPSKEEVTIAVYDMMGKLVETHQVNPTEVANLQIGNNFAAGIYNVIVSQANEMQAIRLIRK